MVDSPESCVICEGGYQRAHGGPSAAVGVREWRIAAGNRVDRGVAETGALNARKRVVRDVRQRTCGGLYGAVTRDHVHMPRLSGCGGSYGESDETDLHKARTLRATDDDCGKGGTCRTDRTGERLGQSGAVGNSFRARTWAEKP